MYGGYKKTGFRFLSVLYGWALFFLHLPACHAVQIKKNVSFTINSVPKGAHVLYQVVEEEIPCQGQWVYLGSTPVQCVRQFNAYQLEDAEKIILKIMHRGYHDQTTEWNGSGFCEEAEARDVIFWTPELVPVPKEQ
jgi:hypothetical protein